MKYKEMNKRNDNYMNIALGTLAVIGMGYFILSERIMNDGMTRNNPPTGRPQHEPRHLEDLLSSGEQTVPVRWREGSIVKMRERDYRYNKDTHYRHSSADDEFEGIIFPEHDGWWGSGIVERDTNHLIYLLGGSTNPRSSCIPAVCNNAQRAIFAQRDSEGWNMNPSLYILDRTGHETFKQGSGNLYRLTADLGDVGSVAISSDCTKAAFTIHRRGESNPNAHYQLWTFTFSPQPGEITDLRHIQNTFVETTDLEFTQEGNALWYTEWKDDTSNWRSEPTLRYLEISAEKQ